MGSFKWISKIACLCVLLATLAVSASAAEVVDSGDCGENAKWTVYDNGELRIHGSGAMRSYTSYYDLPWYNHKNNIVSVIVEEGIDALGAYSFSQMHSLTSATLPNGVPSIPHSIFYGCYSLTTVTIPTSVESIGGSAFLYCGKLTDITIPNGITSIGTQAFDSCKSLTDITIPNSVKEIGFAAFRDCHGLTSITIPDGVTGISESTFAYCSNLKSISLPHSVKEIGSYAFSNCTSLASINIPNSATSIGAGAFRACTSLTSINIPNSMTDIGEATFMDCDSLISVDIPNSVKTIGGYAFKWCQSLVSIDIPDSVTSIGEMAFADCLSLESVSIGNGVTSIGSHAFSNCECLTSVTIPNSVTSIGIQAFADCNSLESVSIGNGVISIGTWAFDSCHRLTSVFFLGDAPTIDAPFHRSSPSALYYIPGTTGWTDSDAYDASSGTWNGYPLKTWDGPAKIQFNTGEYYAVPQKQKFRIYALGANQYPYPTGRTVTVGAQSYVVERGGENKSSLGSIIANVPEGYVGNVKISMPNHYDCVLPVGLTDQDNSILLFPETVIGPFTQALFLDESASEKARSFKDLLHEVINLDEVSLADAEGSYILNLYPLVNWNGHGEGSVWLEQGEIKVPLVANQFNQVDWMDYFFDPQQEIYICTQGADGSKTRLDLAIHIYANRTSELDFDLGEVLSADTSESENEKLDILEDMELSVDLKGDVTSLEIAVQGDGTIQGVIGLTIGKKTFMDEAAWASPSTREQDIRNAYNETKNIIKQLKDKSQDEVCRGVSEYLDDLAAAGVKPTNSHGKFGVNGKVQIIGYVTGKFENGKPVLTEIETVLVVKGSASYTHNTVIAVVGVPVPAHFKITLGAEIGAYMKMEYVAALKKLQPAAAISEGLKGKLSLTGETGPGWEGYLSGGVYGGGAVKAKTSLPIAKANTSFSLQADFGFVGSLMGHGGKWKVFETDEKIFWDAGEWCWKSAEDAQLLAFEPDLTRSAMLMSTAEENCIATGVNGYNAPELVKLSDGRFLAVWVADVTSRGAADKNGVFYSVCTDGIWSAATLVCDDQTNDSVPQLYEENDTVYLAWQNYSQVFGEVLPNYETVDGQINVVMASYNEADASWTTPEPTTPDWYLKEAALPEDYEGEWPATTSKRIFLANEYLSVVLYTAQDDAGINQIYGLFYDGVWGEPLRLTTEALGVNSFHAAMNQDEVLLLFTSGNASSAALKIEQISAGVDLVVHSADYIRSSLIAGGAVSVKVGVENRGTIPVRGVVVNISRNGAEVYSEKVDDRFESGEMETIYISYPLPNIIDFNELQISVSAVEEEEVNTQNNSAVCALYLEDMSLEFPTAVGTDNAVEVSVQIVNRGYIPTSATTLTYHKDTPDGDVLGTAAVPALAVGDLVDITTEFSNIAAGTIIYLAVAEKDSENIIANNSTQAAVTMLQGAETVEILDVSTIGATLLITNNEAGKCYVAVYNTDGQMLSYGLTPVGADAGEVTVSITPFTTTSPYTVKAFLVDTQGIPVCQCAES